MRAASLPRAVGALACALAVVLPGCREESVTAVAVDSVHVWPAGEVLLPGQTTALAVEVRDASGRVLPDRPVVWSSADPEVASVDADGLVEAHAPGVTLVTASSGGATGTAEITTEESPELVVSLSDVRFEAVAGSATGGDRTVSVTSADGRTVPGLAVGVRYLEGEPDGWLEPELFGTTTPATLLLSASAASLSGGVFGADVEVSSELPAIAPRTLRVTIEVAEPPAALVATPQAIGFATAEGQPDPPPQTVEITNVGGGEVTGLTAAITYAGGGANDWLTAGLAGSSAPTTLTLRARAGGLGNGVYDAEVHVTPADAADASSVTVRVRLTVGVPPPYIDLSAGGVVLRAREGPGARASASVAVSNAGSGTLGGLAAEVGGGAGAWLEGSLDAPTAPTFLRIEADATDLPPGSYEGTVSVASPDAINSPRSVSVALVVVARASPSLSSVDADPDSIVGDGVATSTVTVRLRDPRGEPLASGGDTVTLATTAGSLTAVNDKGDGTYSATLTAGAEPAEALVSGTVNGEAIADAARVVFTARLPSGATSTISASPTSLTFLGPRTSTITVRLRDADGVPITWGGHLVELSSSSGSLSQVTDRGDGTYTAVFTPPTSLAGEATISGTVDGVPIEDTAVVGYVLT